MADFLAALGLLLIIEGVFYGGFPQFAKRIVSQVLDLDDGSLRTIGAVSVAGGLLLIWLVRG